MDWREITVEFNGRPVSGSYTVENRIVVVRVPHGVKSREVDTMGPAWLAFRLLRELAAEGKA
jgi:glutamine synthetase